MGKHERDRVHSVGKTVRDDGKRDRETYGRIDLKTEPYANPVDKAVSDNRERRRRSYVGMVVVGVIGFVVMVDEDRFFKKMKSQKASNESQHRVGGFVAPFVREFENFRKELERNDSKKDSGGKRHDEVQTVFETKRYEASNENRREGYRGEDGGMEIHP